MSATPMVMGIDPSLTATGLALTTEARTVRFPDLMGLGRQDAIVRSIARLAEEVRPLLVVMEGPIYSKVTGSYHERAGLWWMVRHELELRRGIPVAIATPQQLKKYATGRGNADKDSVLIACVTRLPDVGAANNNEADAAWLMAMGRDYLGAPLTHMPQLNREVLDSVSWPMRGAA